MSYGTRWVVLLVGVAALVAGCSTPAAVAAPPAPAASPAPPPAPSVSITPPDGTKRVAPAEPVTIKAANGKLAGVTLTDSGGTAVPGAVSADGATWTASGPLKFAQTYHFAGTATGPSGSVPVTGGFATAAPARFAVASVNIADGDTVGVAAPIIVQFNRDLSAAARAAAEKALQVTTSTPVIGSWAWLPDTESGSRAHWRPENYWPAGTTVTMAGHLYGVDMGGGMYGKADLTTHFTIGRSQIVKADATSHRIQVVRDGQVVADLPASYGADSDVRRVTRSGIHIVMGKAETVLMSNPDFHYENVPEHWAVRISNNGEFIHANPASNSAQGNRNITHGCINLNTANAKAYFDTAVYGDPVEITGTRVPLSAQDGDIYDWAIPWDQWTAMSAVH